VGPSRWCLPTVRHSRDPRRPWAVPTARCGGGEGEVRRKRAEDGRGTALTREGVGDGGSCANLARRHPSGGRIWTRSKGGIDGGSRAPAWKADARDPGQRRRPVAFRSGERLCGEEKGGGGGRFGGAMQRRRGRGSGARRPACGRQWPKSGRNGRARPAWRESRGGGGEYVWPVGPSGSEREKKQGCVGRLIWAGTGEEENGPGPRSIVPLYIYSIILSKELN
jgi:hypothetical protein